jgi:fucose permease
MYNRITPGPRLLLTTLGLAFIATGIMSTVPGASLLQLAQNTHVTLAVAGGAFMASAFGFLLSALLVGSFPNLVQPKYLLAAGLLMMGIGSILTPCTDSFALLLFGQALRGAGAGMINIGLNTIATLSFRETLSAKLNTIHGMYGLGALLGPLVLAFGLQFFQSLALSYMVGAIIAAAASALVLAQHLPSSSPRSNATQEQPANTREFRKVLRQSILWMMVLQISLYASAEIGFGSWIVTAVNQSSGVSLALAAPVATAFYIGLTFGRLGGGELLKRERITERRLLYTSIFGGTAAGIVVALFPGQLLVSYIGSILVGCFYGPLFPGIMSITSRRFLHVLGPVSSIMMVGNGITTMVVPTSMGELLPILHINWVIAIPALLCLSMFVPMALANRAQQTTLQLSAEQHTMKITAELPIIQ